MLPASAPTLAASATRRLPFTLRPPTATLSAMQPALGENRSLFPRPLSAFLVPGAAVLLLLPAGCRTRDVAATIRGETMGTTYSVKLAALPTGKSADDVKAGIEARLETVNRQMSTWRKDSEISRFNAHAGTDWFPVSADTVTVLKESRRISELSGGKFDVTVMPLVNLWSFGPESRPRKIPTDEEIADRQKSVGYQMLQFRTESPAVRKTRSDVAVDLSAIAKGFGVDQVAGYLDSLEVPGYMVEIGGEVRCNGTKADGSQWQIGIQSPQKGRNSAHRVVSLNDRSLATSGDYRNYFEQAGKRYSHTIDPHTGRPVTHKLASVSVVAENCMTADGLATAIMVLGPDAGYNLAVKHKLAVLLLVADGKGFVEKATPEFQRLKKVSRER
jgi:FAD:protein FMN transferase